MARCPYCRSYVDRAHGCTALVVTPDQQPYVDRILADSDAVFRQEWREFQAKRAAA